MLPGKEGEKERVGIVVNGLCDGLALRISYKFEDPLVFIYNKSRLS